MKTVDLNFRELQVLEAIKKGHDNSGGDFTYADEVKDALDLKEFTMNQIKGYISQLVQKEYIQVDEEYAQINFTDKCLNIYPNLTERYGVYDRNGGYLS